MLIREDVSHLRGMENNYSLDAEKQIIESSEEFMVSVISVVLGKFEFSTKTNYISHKHLNLIWEL